jgi:hypothetical protein
VLHHFFPKAKKGQVSDARIERIMHECMQVVTQKKIMPRDWYSALMDYGTHLKEAHSNPSRKSRTHVVQKKFIGSVREVRGEIMRQLGQSKDKKINESAVYTLPFEQERIHTALTGLIKDEMVVVEKVGRNQTVRLAK